MIEAIAEIVEIESPSHNADASHAVAAWVEGYFASTGAPLRVERQVVEDGVHLVIRAFEGDRAPTVLLGHTDTVHPIGTRLKNPTRVDDGKFYGCGIFDMKSGIVLMAEALRHFASTGSRPSTPITVVLSCDEEIGSFTGREILEREVAGAACCLVFEPSAAGCVKTARKGTGMFQLKAHGIPSHAGLEPDKGASAVAELARQVERINAISAPEIGTTVNVTTFHGGSTMNVIPEFAECEIDVRFSSEAESERVVRQLAALAPVDGRVSLELAGDINRPPMERTDAVRRLYEKARAIAASFDYELGEAQVGGASDGNFVAAMGVPVLDGLGITGDGAHTLDEHILVSDIARRAKLVTLLLA